MRDHDTRAGSDPARSSSERLERTLELVRELSQLFDPWGAAKESLRRLEQVLPPCRLLLLTRRGFDDDRFGVTELASLAERAVRGDRAHLDELRAGLLADLLDGGRPRLLEDIEGAPDDPGATFLEGRRSLIAIPVFERGLPVETVVLASDRPRVFSSDLLADLTWQVNFHARAAFVAEGIARLRRAYAKLDGDLDYIAGLQQALLPREVTQVPGTRVAVCSRPSERSGGDYYDFFTLPDGQWGILLADVSGHGTVTAVLMAITHAIAHVAPPFARPSDFLTLLDRQLAKRYTAGTDAFVTACACVFDPPTRTLAYSLAGQPAPCLGRGGEVLTLKGAPGAGLGISGASRYSTEKVTVRPDDVLVLFTDGITEARAPDGEHFGEERLHALIADARHGAGLADVIEADICDFVRGRPDQDDRTVLTMRFS